MRKELREKIIAYNKQAKERADKATDLDIIVAEILKLPYGQLKKVLAKDIIDILAKYGVVIQ